MTPGPSRRTPLCGFAAAVLVPTALPACSSGGHREVPAPTDTTEPRGATGTALTPLADVPVGGGVVVEAVRRGHRRAASRPGHDRADPRRRRRGG